MRQKYDPGEHWYIDQLSYQVRLRDAFISDIGNCPKIKVYTRQDDTHWDRKYVFCTKFYPIVVRTEDETGFTGTACPDYYCVDWSLVPEVSITYIDGTTEWANYFKALYVQNYHAHLNNLASAAGLYYINWAIGDKLLVLFEATKYAFPYGVEAKVKEDREGIMASDGAWSSAMWPELPGFTTRYIDNVGVFLPDWAEIDYNLSFSLGSNLVGVSFMRIPSTEAEAAIFNAQSITALLQFLMGGKPNQIPGGSLPGSINNWYEAGRAGSNQPSGFSGQTQGIAQGIQNTIDYGKGLIEKWLGQIRVIFPRVRAFGRQDPSIVSNFSTYNAGIDRVVGSSGWTNFDPKHNQLNFGVSGDRNQQKYGEASILSKVWMSKIIIKLSSLEFEAYYKPLRDYVNNAQSIDTTKMI